MMHMHRDVLSCMHEPAVQMNEYLALRIQEHAYTITGCGSKIVWHCVTALVAVFTCRKTSQGQFSIHRETDSISSHKDFF